MALAVRLVYPNQERRESFGVKERGRPRLEPNLIDEVVVYAVQTRIAAWPLCGEAGSGPDGSRFWKHSSKAKLRNGASCRFTVSEVFGFPCDPAAQRDPLGKQLQKLKIVFFSGVGLSESPAFLVVVQHAEDLELW